MVRTHTADVEGEADDSTVSQTEAAEWMEDNGFRGVIQSTTDVVGHIEDNFKMANEYSSPDGWHIRSVSYNGDGIVFVHIAPSE